MSIIVFFAVLLLLGSAATNNAIDGVKGFQAPIFKVERTDSVVSPLPLYRRKDPTSARPTTDPPKTKTG